MTSSVTFNWAARKFPVKWADRPEDVPEWDVSRGYGGPYLNKEEWEEYRRSQGFVPGPPPVDGYPRLVRIPGEKGVDIGTYNLGAPQGVANKLARLYPYVLHMHERGKEQTLKRKILELAKAYTPYAHYTPDGLTLRMWALAISRVWAALQVAHRLLEKGVKDTKGWVRRNDEAMKEWDGRFYKRRDWPPTPWFQIYAAIKDSASPREARLGLARYLLTLFGLNAGAGDINFFIPSNMDVPVMLAVKGVGEWAYYEVATTVLRRRPVRFCSVCGSPFISMRKDKDTCSDACRKKKSRSQRKNPGGNVLP